MFRTLRECEKSPTSVWKRNWTPSCPPEAGPGSVGDGDHRHQIYDTRFVIMIWGASKSPSVKFFGAILDCGRTFKREFARVNSTEFVLVVSLPFSKYSFLLFLSHCYLLTYTDCGRP